MRYIYLLIFFSTVFFSATAQDSNLRGRITDADSREGVDFATVYLKDTSFVVETDINGYFRITVPVDIKYIIAVSRVGYKDFEKEMKKFRSGERRNLDIGLVPETMDIKVVVTESRIKDVEMITEELTELKKLPSTTGNLESVLPQIALGTNSGTGGELSSQYNVRGGNYDENLVYVNDFEIYRPQLIRSGQQEGLTFANIDLVRNLSFSSGGFQAKYGDKLSSVLDVKYKRPDSLAASVGGSLLGGSAHIEGSISTGDDYRKIRYLIGARYKTTRYLLGSLDTEGEYLPNFADFQGYFTYDVSRNWQLGVIGNFNQSLYNFTPRSRSTALGLVNFGLELRTSFTGQEADDFTNGLGGVSMTYIPDREKNPLYLKFLSSSYRSSEVETIDIIGDYLLGEIETSLGNDAAGEIVNVLGTGTQHQFVRNYLFLEVYNAEHKGGIELQVDREDEKDINHFIQWGAKYQKEIIQDEINEWERLDSAGYSLPFNESQVLVRELLKTQNDLSSNRFMAYIQETYSSRLNNVREWQLTLGLRANYWDLNKELVISPRAQFLYKPLNSLREVSYKLAAGLYAQPALYRELRRPDGTINTDLRSQKSAHIVAGITYDFYLGKIEKPFRFIAEAYYKQLWDLVSFDIDNVRIRYSGENDAAGYAAGLDMRINGEFVKGAESWINLSFLRTRERLDGVVHKDREPGSTEIEEVENVARPTDQFMNLSVFFQDYLRNNNRIRTHVNISVGTGFPFGFPGDNKEFRNTFRFSPYHRVDIGFSFALWNKDRILKKPNHFLKFTKSTWLSLEVFNLLAVSNAASNTWVRTVFNTEFAIPNFLTGRRINLRLKMDF